MSDKPTILAVDDEAFNLDILQTYLEGAGFKVITANDGDIALTKLVQHPEIEVIVLDRMMPRMNGMEVLQSLKTSEKFHDIPVVMQTAAASPQQVIEGIEAGVYYYLPKPFEEVMLTSIVKAALKDIQTKRSMREEVSKHKHVLGLMESSHFHFRTLEEAKNLAYFIANCCPSPENVVYGLSELMLNAVEHGNLGITYREKTILVRSGLWQSEVEKRLSFPENQRKYAFLSYHSQPGYIEIRIKDQGDGFDWNKYLEISPDRATDPHGRGIAVSRMMSFTSMKYIGNGSEVVCVIERD